jgi:hypothetical protein
MNPPSEHSSSPDSQNKKNYLHINNDDSLSLSSVENEDTLQHFTNIENKTTSFPNSEPDLDLYNHDCDSPVTMSYNGSKSGSYNNSLDSDDENNEQFTTKPLSLEDIALITQKNLSNVENNNFKKFTLKDIERSVEKYYHFENNKYVGELDILTTYIKGQKNLYILSKNISQAKLNLLMVPSLLLTCCITIISPIIECHQVYKGFITALNAVVALLLSMINYYKLESSTENFFQMANNYDRLEILLDLASSRLVFINTKKEKQKLVLDTIKEAEQKIVEFKNNYSFLLPEEIKTLFPIICHMKIFFFIQKMETYRHSLLIRLRDVKNEMRFIIFTLTNQDNAQIDTTRLKNRIAYLNDIKQDIKKDLFGCQNAYNDLDGIFTREIKSAEQKMNCCGTWYICFWNFLQSKPNLHNINPVIDKYFHFLFTDE